MSEAAIEARRVRPAAHAGVDKVTLRRNELARAAQKTLSEAGYAGTSLREIAARSEYSHGVLHYYFADKDELIIYCVSLYKQECAQRYDEVIATAQTPEELRAGFLDALIASLHNEGPMHRLWYDLRNQSLFEAVFREDVAIIDGLLCDMVWRVISRYAELAHIEIKMPPRAIYNAMDGVFVQAIWRQAVGDDMDEVETELCEATALLLQAIIQL